MYTNPPSAAAPAGGIGVGVGPDLEKKATTVVVFEGQTLTWTLHVTNRSSQPITGCKVGLTWELLLRLPHCAVLRASGIPELLRQHKIRKLMYSVCARRVLQWEPFSLQAVPILLCQLTHTCAMCLPALIPLWSSCLQVTVLNAKGTVLKPPAAMSAAAAGAAGQQQQQQQALLHPPGLTGAYLEVLDQGLAAALPLNPGASASLPVTVVVGKPPGSMYEASTVQVCLVFTQYCLHQFL
jgi:hypothetical protein